MPVVLKCAHSQDVHVLGGVLGNGSPILLGHPASPARLYPRVVDALLSQSGAYRRVQPCQQLVRGPFRGAVHKAIGKATEGAVTGSTLPVLNPAVGPLGQTGSVG